MNYVYVAGKIIYITTNGTMLLVESKDDQENATYIYVNIEQLPKAAQQGQGIEIHGTLAYNLSVNAYKATVTPETNGIISLCILNVIIDSDEQDAIMMTVGDNTIDKHCIIADPYRIKDWHGRVVTTLTGRDQMKIKILGAYKDGVIKKS